MVLDEVAIMTHYFKCISAAVVTLALLVVPMGIGLAFVVTPVAETAPPAFVVAVAQDIPADGLPHRFPVMAARRNVWSLAPPETVDYVFLQRSSDTSEVTAMSAWHSRFKIPVEFIASEQRFVSVCWDVEFDSYGHALTTGFDDLRRFPVVVVDQGMQVNFQ